MFNIIECQNQDGFSREGCNHIEQKQIVSYDLSTKILDQKVNYNIVYFLADIILYDQMWYIS